MNEFSYDIEQLFIEGFNPKTIAMILDCPIDIVYDWIDQFGIEVEMSEEDMVE